METAPALQESKRNSAGIPFLRVTLFLFAIAWLGLLCWGHRRVVVDDPWITFRYARNVAEGRGFVFNEGERLEGYSNFTWVLVNTVPVVANIEPLGFARLMAFLSAAVLLGLLCFGVRDREDSDAGLPQWQQGLASDVPRSGTAALLLAGAFPFAVWVMGALETAVYTLAIYLFIVFLSAAAARGRLRDGLLAGGVLAFAGMTRPEAPMFAAVGLGALLLAPRENRRSLLAGAAVFLGIYAVYTVWRWTYFGSLVPNTVSAKLGGDAPLRLLRGFVYTLWFFLGPGSLLIVLALWALVRQAMPWGSNTSPMVRCLSWTCAAVVVMQLAFVFAVGGDWMPGGRFLVPMLPALCLLAAVAMRPWPTFVRWVVIAFFLVGSLIQARRDPLLRWYRWAAREQGGAHLAQPLVDAGRWLAENAPRDALVASSEAGALPYYSRLRYVDMLGLVDRHIASLQGDLHQKYDAAYVLERAPDFVALQLEERDGEWLPAWPSDRQLFEQEVFQDSYREVARFPRLMAGNVLPSLRNGALVIYQRTPRE